MNTGKKAEEFVLAYFKRKGITLAKAGKGEGCDFKSGPSVYVEVKGTTFESIAKLPFRYFTEKEYEKAQSCRDDGTQYEIHLIVDINASQPKHYIIPGDELLDRGKAETVWSLSIRNEYEKFKVKNDVQ